MDWHPPPLSSKINDIFPSKVSYREPCNDGMKIDFNDWNGLGWLKYIFDTQLIMETKSRFSLLCISNLHFNTVRWGTILAKAQGLARVRSRF